MEATDNMERLIPLEEEFCFLEFLRGGDVPFSSILKEAPGLVWRLEQQGESVAVGAYVYSTAGHCSVGTSSNGQETKHRWWGL